MGESSPTVTFAWLRPDVLLNFIEELRQADYNIGVAQYVAVQDLILALVAQGESFDQPQRLKTLLGPILCGSPSEQIDFQYRFDQWVLRMDFQPTPGTTTAAAEALAHDLDDLEERSQRWLVWLLAAVGGAILLLLIFLFGGQLNSSLSDGNLASSNLPDLSSLVNININPSLLTAALLAPVLIYAGWRLWWRYRARLFLERRSTTHEPKIERISMGGLDETLFPSVPFFRLAQAFRRRVDAPSSDLDVDATVSATIAQAGQFTPVYGRLQHQPEYLILIDRAAYGDHQAHYVTSMVDRLAKNEVFINRYYFDSDPRLCFPSDSDSSPRSLRDLAAHYHQHRLVVFTDANSMFDRRTGALARWLMQFSAWPERALLTPVTLGQWGYRERELSRQFTLLPATTDGLAALTYYLDRGESDISNNGQARAPYPPMLQDRPRRWIARDEPSEKAVQEMLLALRSYLDGAGYEWLAACAIYPGLHWNLTLYLGETLKAANGDKLLQPDRLVALARLPWFRQGYLPDWLRIRLIEAMPKKKEKAVRAALEALLVTAVQGDADEFNLEIAQAHNYSLSALVQSLLRLLVRKASDDNPITDHVFLNFMNVRHQKPLAVRLPETLSRRLQYRLAPPLSVPWRLWPLWMVVNVVGQGIGLFLALIITNVFSFSSDSFLEGLLAGFLWGGGIGFMQWLVLRRYHVSAWWIIFSTLGIAIGLGMDAWYFGLVPVSINGGIFIGAAVGLISGVAQWLVLRRSIQYAELWIGASVVSWLVTWIAFTYFSRDGITGLVLGLVIYGALSGLAMRWMLQFPCADSEPQFRPARQLKSSVNAFNWRLIRDWLYVSTSGIILSVLLTGLVLILGALLPLGFLFALVGFVPVGYFQGRVLDRLVLARRNWTKLSGTGWILGVIVAGVILLLIFSINTSPTAIVVAIGFSLSGAAIGFFVGTAQWISLRNDLDRAKLWIWGNVVGLAFGWGIFAGWAIAIPGIEILFIILGILYYGLLTGVLLVWLSPQAATYPMTSDATGVASGLAIDKLIADQEPIESKQVKKNIRDMRQTFGLLGILFAFCTFLIPVYAGIGVSLSSVIISLTCGIIAVCFFVAFRGLGKRSVTGFNFARISSVILLFGFLILTPLGVSYLIKLSKPEMKRALGKD